MPEEPEVITVHLRRRTPEEQVEWLILQVAFLIAKVNRLEEESAAYRLAIQSLENRLTPIERATPWKKPKPPRHEGSPRARGDF